MAVTEAYEKLPPSAVHNCHQYLVIQGVRLAAIRCRKEGCEMTTKAMMRLDLRLPHDHPIFNYDVETRQRAKIARIWLDTGAMISSLEARISSIEDRFSSMEDGIARIQAEFSYIEKQLAEILGKLDSEGHAKSRQENPPAPKDDAKKEFDPVAFGKNIEDAFS